MFSMWMAELSSRSGLTVPTIKYYLREGLLHPGESTGATRAKYDESHLSRLRLIRALSDIAGLRLETVRNVLAEIDSAENWRTAVASAHMRLSPDAGHASAESLARVQDFLERQGWSLKPHNPLRAMLGRALDALESVEHPLDDALLDTYAEGMMKAARSEIEHLPEDPETAAAMAVVGTVLLEPVLLGIRRIAQQNAAMQLSQPS